MTNCSNYIKYSEYNANHRKALKDFYRMGGDIVHLNITYEYGYFFIFFVTWKIFSLKKFIL